MARDGVGGLLVLADTITYVHRVRLNELCLQRRVPSVWGGRDFLTGGGLASYQSDWPAIIDGRGQLLVMPDRLWPSSEVHRMIRSADAAR